MMKRQCAVIPAQQACTLVVSEQSRWTAAWRQVARWYELGRQRHALAALSDNALKDLGLSRADIHEESERLFWDDPLKK